MNPSGVGTTIQKALRSAMGTIDLGDPAEARLVAELLLAGSLGVDRAGLYARFGEPVPEPAAARFADLIARYRAGEPAAYLVGRREFFGLDLLVTPAVLIPRPETELLVERALDLLNSEWAAGRWPRVADVGTGSGAIAIALATSLPDLEVWAVDLAAAALAVARKNARRHGVADRIRFLEGDLVAALPEPVDIILANLPYVPSPDGRIAAETAGWEPDLALDGGPDGLSVIGRLLHHAPDRLTRPGWILLEVGAGQAGGVRAIAERTLRPVAVETARDVHGHERLVVLRCPIS